MHVEDFAGRTWSPELNHSAQQRQEISNLKFLSPRSDWKDNLEDISDIRVLDFHAGNSETSPDSWLEKQFSRADLVASYIPESTMFRLYLIQGVSQADISLFNQCLEIDEIFFRHHYNDNLPYSTPSLAARTQEYFFAKWPRRVLQRRERWDAECRIAAGRPFSPKHGSKDPDILGVDHTLFARFPAIHRPYGPLDPNINAVAPSMLIQHAAMEAASYFCGTKHNRQIGILLFDPPRKHKLSRHTYKYGSLNKTEAVLHDCFFNEISTRDRFICDLKKQQKEEKRPQVSHPPALSSEQVAIRNRGSAAKPEVVRNILLDFMLADYLEVLSVQSSSLDVIDISLAENKLLRACLDYWRFLFGRWRKSLASHHDGISYALGTLKRVHGSDQTIGDNSSSCPDYLADFQELENAICKLQRRTDSTFQALMSTMAIVESQKAISQARTISKLTNLAFFFVPLTLSSSLFGMNINEFLNKPIWLWGGISAIFLLVTYIVLFFHELTSFFLYFQSQSTFHRIRRHCLISQYYLRRCGSFLVSRTGIYLIVTVFFLTGLCIGIWVLVSSTTRFRMGDAARTGLGIALVGSGLLFGCVVGTLHFFTHGPKNYPRN